MAFIAPVNTGDIIQASTVNGLVNGSIWYSADTGVAGVTNPYKVTFDGVAGNKNKITAPLNDGLIVTFKASFTNVINSAFTGAATLEIIGPSGTLGLKPIVKGGGLPLAPSDIRAGEMVTVVYNAVSNRFQLLTMALGSAHGASALLAVDTPAANMVWTAIPLGSPQFDNGGFYNAATNTRLTVPSGLDGTYLVIFTAGFAANTVGRRYATVRLNGSSLGDRPQTPSVYDFFIYFPLLLRLVAGDFVEGFVWQDSGTALPGLLVRGAGATSLQLVRVNS
jgi:hypothetical protein